MWGQALAVGSYAAWSKGNLASPDSILKEVSFIPVYRRRSEAGPGWASLDNFRTLGIEAIPDCLVRGPSGVMRAGEQGSESVKVS